MIRHRQLNIKHLLPISLLPLLACSSAQRSIPTVKVLAYANDSLSIDIREIKNRADSTTTIYVLDASLDKRVEELVAELKTKTTAMKYRIIGIGHSKYSGKKRKRDFAPPNDTSFFGANARFNGRADDFLQLIKDSIIPKYDATSNQRILVGHSFGGLFGVYVSTLSSQPFDEIYALSPSLWVNHNSFAKHYSVTDSLKIKTPLHISYGSLEQLNLVGPAIKRFERNLKKSDSAVVSIKSVSGKTHISMIKEILKLEY